MPIEYWNPTPIYCENCNLEDSLLNELNSVENENVNLYSANAWGDSVFSTFHNCTNIVQKFKMYETQKFLTQHFLLYFHNLDTLPVKYHIINSWFNKILKNGFQDKHVHMHKSISGVLYYDFLNKEKEEGIEFIFKNTFGNYINSTVSYEYVPGRIVLFPGDVEHRVPFKKTDGVRKSFSFNIAYE